MGVAFVKLMRDFLFTSRALGLFFILVTTPSCGDLSSGRNRTFTSLSQANTTLVSDLNLVPGYDCGSSGAPEVLPLDELFHNNPSYDPNNNDYLKYKICSAIDSTTRFMIRRMSLSPSGGANIVVIFPALIQNNLLTTQKRLIDGMPRAITLDLGQSGSAVVSFASDSAYYPTSLGINAFVIADWVTAEDQSNFISLASCVQSGSVQSCQLPITKPFSYGKIR